MRKQFYLALLLLFWGFEASASHVQAMDIRYEYTGSGNVYRVFVSYYKECLVNNAGLGNSVQVAFSSSCFLSYSIRTLPLTNTVFYSNMCNVNTSSCSTIMNTAIGGFQLNEYSDTITLPPCSDWKMSTNLCCRTSTIVNLNNSSSTGTYVEAFLNNATMINSCAYIISPAAQYFGTNGVYSIPNQTIDIDGDSLYAHWTQPQDLGTSSGTSTTGISLPYATGYSLIDPLGSGGIVSLNAINQNIQLYAPNVGNYQLAYKISDYRNGTLVGYTMRDFMVSALNFPNPTNPIAAPNSNFAYTTCPGLNNSISLTINDNTATDSVYLTVNPPTIPGFTFNVTNNNGLGSATTNISWTTPANFNPATLPNFYIGVMAKDNVCTLGGQSFFAIKINTAQCSADSVWAGDANGDWTVNVYDPLAIGVAYGSTGTLRPSATTNWQAEFCMNWVDTFANGINMKHADCNGDGVVDTLDIAPIYTNFGNWHLKPSPAAKTTNVPNLYFDISGIPFIAGTTVNIPVKLGDATNPMSNIYGIAGGIQLSGITLATAPQISYTGSWLGNATNTLHFNKSAVSGTIDWALSRIDHQNTSGQGTIAWVSFHIPADANGQTLALSFSNIKLVDKALGNITSFNALDTSVLIHTMGINDFNATIQNAAIVPNPSHNEAALSFSSIKAFEMKIEAFDVSGKMVFNQTTFATKGINEIKLPTQSLSQGVYIVKLSGNDFLETMKWVKE